jgi:ABC-type sugar transport system substrate-binding protein
MAKKWMTALIAALATTCVTAATFADEYDDGQIKLTREGLKGKKVGFVPLSLGFDLPQAWYEGLKQDAAKWGYKVIVRDPNWNVQVGAQALNQLIADKPDVLIFHPLETQAYAKLVKKAMADGINVIQVNMKSPNNGDAYVGANWYEIGAAAGKQLAKICGSGSGKSGKVAIVQGVPTTATSQIAIPGFQDELKKHPEITIVANQAADWDATKAHAVASTIIKQNPDLCGIYDLWEVQAMGTAAAIHEAGKQNDIALVTYGGGQKQATCDNVANGTFTADIVADAKVQAADLVNTVDFLLQAKPKPGSAPFGVYTPTAVIDKNNANAAGLCWTMDGLKENGVR